MAHHADGRWLRMRAQRQSRIFSATVRFATQPYAHFALACELRVKAHSEPVALREKRAISRRPQ
jgi:hypothetical protein